MRFRPSLKQFVMRVGARGGVLSLVAFTGLIGAGPATTVAYAAGTTQNYLVVFKASHIPAGQAAKFQAASPPTVNGWLALAMLLRHHAGRPVLHHLQAPQ